MNFFHSLDLNCIEIGFLILYIFWTADQYNWLESDLGNLNRLETPWVVATWSLPWYSTFKGHYREAESMRISLEDVLYSYRVDIIFNGQVRCSSVVECCFFASGGYVLFH